LNFREVENASLLELRDFNLCGNACIFARKHFIVREETSHEREEKRTHVVVSLGSVNVRAVGAWHGGARAERIKTSSHAVVGLGSTSVVLVITNLVNVRGAIMIVAVAVLASGRISNVLSRKKRRNLIDNGRRIFAKTAHAKLTAVAGHAATSETLTVRNFLDARGDVGQRGGSARDERWKRSRQRRIKE
jgi:hypothetical protein